ncbi:MAG: DnaB-like helicase C-terminal domain-containing protein [Candidatus Nitrosotenuis sp.]
MRYKCFAGCGDFSLVDFYVELFGKQAFDALIRISSPDMQRPREPEPEGEGVPGGDAPSPSLLHIAPPPCDGVPLEEARRFLLDRKISPQLYRRVGAKFRRDGERFLSIEFKGSFDQVIARRFSSEEPRYLHLQGKKRVFYFPQYLNLNEETSPIVFVEGIFDLLALYEIGYHAVVALGGTILNDHDSFLFHKKVCFLLLDRDYAGWVASKKIASQLRAVEAYPIIISLPSPYKDVHEFFATDRAKCTQWVQQTVIGRFQDDSAYLAHEFLTSDVLHVVPTPFEGLNKLLGGGFKDGIHILAGRPGVGKTRLALFLTHFFAQQGYRVLFVTYEISKRQVWATLLSITSGKKIQWTAIEEKPSAAHIHSDHLAHRIKVETGLSIEELCFASRFFDIIVVDYLQRIPRTAQDARSEISSHIQLLSNFARDYGKIYLVVSSLSRAGYGVQDIGYFKETGDIEFVAQSAAILSNAAIDESEVVLKYSLIKNTRGPTGTIALNAWLDYAFFEEIPLVVGA